VVLKPSETFSAERGTYPTGTMIAQMGDILGHLSESEILRHIQWRIAMRNVYCRAEKMYIKHLSVTTTESLDIAWCLVDCKFPHATHLDFGDGSFPEYIVGSIVKSAPQLKSLSFIAHGPGSVVFGCKTLEELCIGVKKVSEWDSNRHLPQQWLHLERFPKLRKLVLHDPNGDFTTDYWLWIRILTHPGLQEFRLINSRIQYPSNAEVETTPPQSSTLKILQYLSIHNQPPPVLPPTIKFPKLEVLDCIAVTNCHNGSTECIKKSSALVSSIVSTSKNIHTIKYVATGEILDALYKAGPFDSIRNVYIFSHFDVYFPTPELESHMFPNATIHHLNNLAYK
jgi:hypothetical protein